MIRQNCRCAGCCMLAIEGSCYCREHSGDAPKYPEYKTTTSTGGVSRTVSYSTTVGNPENDRNKL